MTAVTRWSRGPLHVVGGIKRHPPIGAGFDEIGKPFFVYDIPLRWKREIVVSNFGEIALLPDTSVHEGDLVFGEFGNGVTGEVGNDGIRVFARIANYIGHRSVFPSCI